MSGALNDAAAKKCDIDVDSLTLKSTDSFSWGKLEWDFE